MRFLKQMVLALLLAVSAQASDALLNSLQPRGLVNDYANVISPADENQLSSILTELRQKTGAEVAVVTLPSLDGGQIDDFAVRLYERWGIGQKGKDNGVLLLAAIQDRKARIEVGYGLEGIIPDGLAGRILREDVFPPFKQQRYGAGLTAGAIRMASLIASEQGLQLSGAPRQMYSRGYGSQAQQRKGNPIVSILFFIGFIYMAIRHPRLLLLMMIMSGRGGGRSGGGFGGGGFGGFGGGMSGGGGASGGW